MAQSRFAAGQSVAMDFHADLHVHSKYSRATSRDLDLEHMAWWAARKGIAVIGTGDCVHPAWLAEIRDKLVPAGGGLFRLKPELEAQVAKTLPPSCVAPVHFMLSVEISTIYKKGDRTRKIHHLIYAPDFEAVDRLAASLGRIGNIASDGRPILGLDSRDLLEITLESGPHSYLVPAHIWTPWFAALGSQSGFDSIAECYGDLADQIFAVETGLSSDPAMNWRVSFLDRYRLTSNSDAHSPGKLGREATRFSCDLDYFAIRHALESGQGYLGTVEFFPEEGKYHLDGHRACGVRLEPTQTIAHGGLCPVCHARVTVGVAHRVEALADRTSADVRPPATAGDVTNLVPLPEILSEIVGAGAGSKAVTHAYDCATALLGPELSVLQEVPVEDIARADPLLGEAVGRLRTGAVIRQAGYDGEYGVIRIFDDRELEHFTKGGLLFDAPRRGRARAAEPMPATQAQSAICLPLAEPSQSVRADSILSALDADQRRGAEAVEGPTVILAGPGSGKTRMLTHRLAHLIVDCGVPAASCLAVTFTRRATEELQQRLHGLLPPGTRCCPVHSFHSLGLTILRAHGATLGLAPDFRIASDRERAAALASALSVSESKAARLLRAVSVAKRTGAAVDGEVGVALGAYTRLGKEQNWIDFDDLVGLSVMLLETHADVAQLWRRRFRHICVDEFQDVDEAQYRLLRLLATPDGNICVIGDPNQAIYGFRGADAACFDRFQQDFLNVRTVRLGRNYRSTGTIVAASSQLIGSATRSDVTRPMQEPITLHSAPSERAEAEFVVNAIESLLGGHDMLAAGKRQRGGRQPNGPLGFSDFAVLYRTDGQSAALREAFDQAGVPFKKSSPAPIAAQSCVQAMLQALDLQDSNFSEAGLQVRIAAAVEQVRGIAAGPDATALAEAKRWLTALADADDVAALREKVALSTEADFWDARADRVSLLTMHAAKGLEFSVVFVVGLEDGLMPFSFNAMSPEGKLEEDGRDRAGAEPEERRLLYVAMTRAKDRLFLSRVAQRSWRGRLITLPPSRYLRDIAPELMVQQSSPVRRQRAGAQQYSLF
jgi:DNA helicase II / ATP-dependent DNA helicase PcrA